MGYKWNPVVIAVPTTGAENGTPRRGIMLHIAALGRAGIRVIRAECGAAMHSEILSW